jgi:poly-gamma-glutamate synthesis protein (capsule biosynthesis protein)
MVTLFLCGDVMTGRGVDQILAHPCPPGIQEPYVRDARDYVALAEEANGPIPRPVSPTYIWGDALQELERIAPDARIINLETSVTTSDDVWPGKGIHYRMHHGTSVPHGFRASISASLRTITCSTTGAQASADHCHADRGRG